jgi:hypothetical protein
MSNDPLNLNLNISASGLIVGFEHRGKASRNFD